MTKQAIGVLALVVTFACMGGAANGADVSALNYRYEVLLDTDNDLSSGGPVTIVQLGESPHDEQGIDYIVRVGASNFSMDVFTTCTDTTLPFTSSGEIVQRDVLKWNADTQTFDVVDCNHTTYPIGLGPGGEGLVEFGAALDLIGNPPGPMRALFHASQAGSFNDYTASFPILLPARAPALSATGLAVLFVLLTGSALFLLARQGRRSTASAVLLAALVLATAAWATAIVLDGNFDDWDGIPAAVTDVPMDSSNHDPAEDILAGYVVVQSDHIFFRMDLAGTIPSACPP